jgi:hypothetical protein
MKNSKIRTKNIRQREVVPNQSLSLNFGQTRRYVPREVFGK